MPDLLCSLVYLPDIEPFLRSLRKQAIFLRRPNPWEKEKVRGFVKGNWSSNWAQEVDVAFSRQPVSCFIATKEDDIVGFSAYECTRRGFFGPMGVLLEHRKKGIGTALLLAGLMGLQDLGYVYGIIGAAGPVDFYNRACGAVPITLNGRGIYGLKEEPRFMRPSKKETR